MLLNKRDLATETELQRLEHRIKEINVLAKMHRTDNSAVRMEEILEIGAFDLERILLTHPKDLASDAPARSGPSRPGPFVNAIMEMSCKFRLDLLNNKSKRGINFLT